jgi:hypothetical protein
MVACMAASTHPASTTATSKARAPGRHRTLLIDIGVSALLVFGVLAAWAISRLGLFRSGDALSYWLAVAGGIMMLLVFLYPLRKHVRALHRLGQAKGWLWVHIALGLVGPWLILLHSTFQIGSVNAGVALASMVIVVLSGIAGRFLYVRVHRGLDGERTTLRELQQRAGFVEAEARSRLHFAPRVEALLLAFEQRELQSAPGWGSTLRRVAWLPLLQWRTERQCVSEVRAALRAQAGVQGWDRRDVARRQRHARRLVQQYLGAVVRVAQFTAYDRVFGLWHVAHLPFVVLLVFSAVVHVVAVHAY